MSRGLGDVYKRQLLEFDQKGIRESGYDPTVAVIITNTFDYSQVAVMTGTKKELAPVIEIQK